jgi:prepilin-type N-terminal cleavage/methylation domain-containing protein
MKTIHHLKRKGGFTLAECLIALVIFAIMTLILMSMLTYSILLKTQNDQTVTDMNEQVIEIAGNNMQQPGRREVITDIGDGNIIFTTQRMCSIGITATHDCAENLPLPNPTCNIVTQPIHLCRVTVPGHNCSDTPPVPLCDMGPAEIEGGIVTYSDPDVALRIAEPVFEPGWNELDAIVDLHGAPTGSFFSTFSISTPALIQIPPSTPGDPYTWQIDLSYAAMNTIHVTYIVLPPGVWGKISVLSENATSRILQSDTFGAAIRLVFDQGSTWMRAEIKFTAPQDMPDPTATPTMPLPVPPPWYDHMFFPHFNAGIDDGTQWVLMTTPSDDPNYTEATAPGTKPIPERSGSIFHGDWTY